MPTYTSIDQLPPEHRERAGWVRGRATMTEQYTLYHGDCLDILSTLEAGSIDAVITDPDYGIGKDFPNKRKSTKFTGGFDLGGVPSGGFFDFISQVKTYVIW
ncbi:hypothetical protein KC887_09485, partial [Candidatus Kaiserbacteria bacterium]|nr:hypothetical protein [Candidatus Kaiserbacteria bacterium]